MLIYVHDYCMIFASAIAGESKDKSACCHESGSAKSGGNRFQTTEPLLGAFVFLTPWWFWLDAVQHQFDGAHEPDLSFSWSRFFWIEAVGTLYRYKNAFFVIGN